jgi:hypothetical protein
MHSTDKEISKAIDMDISMVPRKKSTYNNKGKSFMSD